MGWWDFSAVDAELRALIQESPITRESVVADCLEFLAAGEIALAFETLADWLFEDQLAISRIYYERLAAIASEISCQPAMARLDELVLE
ncbi:MafI family immunity protein [Paractinoplanes durhamensis]|uniref:MafI family immunity protein n=1 Tax=Paractinoplanes durhamensis TaxID=113563 RepID=A0ABQ3ZE48_9ACTN|nr:MafI family immunity protein [Actinoplanes durhamensis]GIE08105.1 hypothetical protein Adu01nite_94550 [Actinoplanes durhamensis]